MASGVGVGSWKNSRRTDRFEARLRVVVMAWRRLGMGTADWAAARRFNWGLLARSRLVRHGRRLAAHTLESTSLHESTPHGRPNLLCALTPPHQGILSHQGQLFRNNRSEGTALLQESLLILPSPPPPSSSSSFPFIVSQPARRFSGAAAAAAVPARCPQPCKSAMTSACDESIQLTDSRPASHPIYR